MGLESTSKINFSGSDLMSIGQNLKKIRNRNNLTQGQLSEFADISLNQISRIERGTAKPELETIKKLSKALHCSADELIFDDGDYVQSDELRLLFSAVEDLSNDKIEMIKDFIEAILMKDDMEKWVNKTYKENLKQEIELEIENEHAPQICKKCGGKMKKAQLTELEEKAGTIAAYECIDCGFRSIFSGNIS